MDIWTITQYEPYSNNGSGAFAVVCSARTKTIALDIIAEFIGNNKRKLLPEFSADVITFECETKAGYRYYVEATKNRLYEV